MSLNPMNWVTGLLSRYLGSKFFASVSSSTMSWVGGVLMALSLPGVTVEDITDFTTAGVKILAGLGMLALAYAVDILSGKAKAPEQPQVIKD